ncbi:MAG TPA: hypothetical protein VMI10_13770 [Terriglobales bacterium]|nr:hypothetical protein [Terriglobales bacterium]
MSEQATQSNSFKVAATAAPSDARRGEHEEMLRVVTDPALTGDRALALLERADLPADVIEQLARNRSAMKLPKVKLALACHSHAPRHVSVPLIRQFYTFDLMRVALSPVVPADVKFSADEVLLGRLKTITSGERLTLARRASGRVAGALLIDADERIMRAALENARLTEVFVIQAVLKPDAGAALVQTVSQHVKWSYRRDVQLALLRTEHLSLARALAFSHELSPAQLAEILRTSHLPAQIKTQLLTQREDTKAAPTAE